MAVQIIGMVTIGLILMLLTLMSVLLHAAWPKVVAALRYDAARTVSRAALPWPTFARAT